MIFESVWRDPNLHINKGRQWNAFSDQLSADDMNFIVSNINYVKERLTTGQGTLVSINGTPVLSFDATDLVYKTTMDLVNYYSKEEINGMIGGGSSLKIEIVDELPTENASSSTIYLTPNNDSNNTYKEWLYINNKWELIGSTNIDLTNYYTIEQIDAMINSIVNNTTVIGPKDDNGALLFGKNSSAGSYGTAIGNNAQNSSSNGTTVGNLSSAGNYGATIGRDAHSHDYGVAVGATSYGAGGVAVGYNAKGYNASSVVVGKSAKATANNAIQIGTGTNGTADTVQFRNDNVYNTETHTLTVQKAQVGGKWITQVNANNELEWIYVG